MNPNEKAYTAEIIKAIIKFLQLFMCETLAKRIVSMMLFVTGYPNKRITELTGLCDKSIRTLKKTIEAGEHDSLFHVGGGGQKSKLCDIEAEIVKEINEGDYQSQQQIVDMVYEKYGIKVTQPTISRLIKKNGIKRLKCGSLPAKADIEEQRTFYDTVLHPLMDLANRGTVALLFMDASHFVMGCDFLGYIYGFARKFIRTYSGRKRYNVLGALNFVTKKMTTVVNDTYITSTEICELLKKLAIEYAGVPICLILDNARYQKCVIVETLARELGIALTYIPAYSPNLNLIERLWKHVKGRLRTKYYYEFDEFKGKIDSIIDDSSTKDKYLIDRLIGEKVQLFDDIPPAQNEFVKSNEKKSRVVSLPSNDMLLAA
jgi:transposase